MKITHPSLLDLECIYIGNSKKEWGGDHNFELQENFLLKILCPSLSCGYKGGCIDMLTTILPTPASTPPVLTIGVHGISFVFNRSLMATVGYRLLVTFMS